MQVYGSSSYYLPNSNSRNTASSQDAKNLLSLPANQLPGKNDILRESFFFAEQKTPQTDVSGPVAALRILQSLGYLTSLFQQTETPIIPNIDKKSQSVGVKTDILKGIKNSLQVLNSTVTRLLQNDALNTRSTQSSQPDAVALKAGKESPITSISVEAAQVSSSNTLASNEQSLPYSALGLTGNFIVNGYNISVVSSDTIITIKDKINYGSDYNHNGIQDGPQDIDGTGQSEIIFVRPGRFTPGVYIVKDNEGKGYLYPNEDANNTGLIVGGSKQNNIVATIENNRLKLASQAGGSNSIDLQDPDNVLLALGFFELNSKGMPIQKEVQYTTSNSVTRLPANLIISPEKAVIKIDGKTVTSDSNVFEGVVPDASLNVKLVSSAPAEISTFLDPTNATNQIKILFSHFNEAMKKLNGALMTSKIFETDVDIQRIRNALTQSQKKTSDAAKRNEGIDSVRAKYQNPSAIGFDVKNTEKNTVQETAVTSFVQSIKDQVEMPFKNSPADLYKRLSSMGIRTAEDNSFSVNEAELNQALTVNSKEVLDLLTNPETGILTRLKSHLSDILAKGIGRVDYKESKIEGISKVPITLADKFQDFAKNSAEQKKSQTLIAVA